MRTIPKSSTTLKRELIDLLEQDGQMTMQIDKRIARQSRLKQDIRRLRERIADMEMANGKGAL